MRGVNERTFLNHWEMLLAASCPGPTALHWRVAEVEWHKQRHGYAGADYTIRLEVHRLRHGGDAGWELLVVKEYWWSGETILKSGAWARTVQGSPKAIIAWVRHHAPSHAGTETRD